MQGGRAAGDGDNKGQPSLSGIECTAQSPSAMLWRVCVVESKDEKIAGRNE